MFSTPQAREPSRAKTGPFFQERTPQGEVTNNCSVNPRLLEIRQAVKKRYPAENAVFGQAGKAEDLSLHPNELVFAPKGTKTGGNHFAGEPGVTVFSAFNGIAIEGRDQYEFESDFQLIGLNKSTYLLDDEQQPRNGVSVRTRGSGTTWNTGNKEILVGDTIVWRLPSVDPRKRGKEMHQRIEGIPSNKILAILEPIDLRGNYRLTESAISWLMQSQARESRIEMLDPAHGASLDKRQEYAVALKSNALGNLYHGMMALVNLGIITINAPPNPLSAATYNDYAQTLERRSLLDAIEERVEVDADGNVTEVRPKTGDERDRDEDKAVWLGSKLGLVNRGHLQESGPVTRAVLGRQFAGIMVDPVAQDAYSEKHVFIKEPIYVRGTTLPKFNRRNPAARIVQHQLSYPTQGQAAFNIAYDSIQSQVVGRALNSANPGEYLDILM